GLPYVPPTVNAPVDKPGQSGSVTLRTSIVRAVAGSQQGSMNNCLISVLAHPASVRMRSTIFLFPKDSYTTSCGPSALLRRGVAPDPKSHSKEVILPIPATELLIKLMVSMS